MIENKWDDNSAVAQAEMIAYYQIRDYEEQTKGI